MRRHTGKLLLLGLAVLVLPQIAAAQLQTGTWTGTIAPPGDQPVPVTFDVKGRGDSTSILLKTPMGEVPFTQIKLLADRITFVFMPGGDTVSCTLMLRPDKSYGGDCKDEAGGTGQIVMIPPKSGPPDEAHTPAAASM